MRAKRRDRNHAELRDGLRAAGILVCDTGSIGSGFPDLVAIHAVTGAVLLLEVKDGKKVKSARKLTPAQVKFTRMWPVVIVTSLEEAMAVCGVTAKTQEG